MSSENEKNNLIKRETERLKNQKPKKENVKSLDDVLDGFYKKRTSPVRIKRPIINGKEISINYAKNIVYKMGCKVMDGFVVDDENKLAYNLLTRYFIGDETFKGTYSLKCDALGKNTYNYDLRKGLLLMGATGTGKTDCLRIFTDFSRLLQNGVNIQYRNCKVMEDDFKIKGYEYLQRYRINKNYLFDDLGQEGAITRHYKDELILMESVLTDVYNGWKNTGNLTFITTNLNGEMIYQRYGERIYERIGEMYNIITLTGKNRRANGNSKN